MSITFSGLASGLDTASIVESLIEVESVPITTMEAKQEYLEEKRDVYTEFNSLVEELGISVMALNSTSDLNDFEVNNNGSEYFSISTTSLTDAGSYEVEVVSLARQQKDISSEGFSDTDSTTLSGTLQIGETTLEYDGLTLGELVDLINDEECGVTASMVDVGTDEDGFRLVLTADSAGEDLEILGSGSIVMDTATDGHTVEGSKAHVVVDGIDYYSSTNTLTSPIHGASLTVYAESDNGADTVTVSTNTEDLLTEKLTDIIEAYNAIVEYSSTIYESDPTLGNSLKSVQRGLKNYLSSSGLVNIGVATEWETGELSLDTDMLSEALAEDMDGVIETLLNSDDGLLVRFDEYISEVLDNTDGFLATREESIDEEVDRLDERITAMETRLEKRQEMLEAQFTAMETLVASLNTQSDFLTSFFESYNS